MRTPHFLPIFLVATLAGCRGSSQDDAVGEDHTDSIGSTGEDGVEAGEGVETLGSETGTETGDECELSCEGATELAEGIVQCSDGRVIRTGGGTFDPSNSAPACMGNEAAMECASDADCNSGAYGKCIHGGGFGEFGEDQTWCRCAYSCSTDDDCAAGSLCLPKEALPALYSPICVPASCGASDDCECGQCGIGAWFDCSGRNFVVQCRTMEDMCNLGAGTECGGCFPSPGGQWTCHSVECP